VIIKLLIGEALGTKAMIKSKSKEKFNIETLKKYTKEIAMTVFAVGLIAMGYANYQTEESISVASSQNVITNDISYETAVLANDNSLDNEKNELKLGDVELVNSEVADEESISSEISYEEDYFTQTRLDRDLMYSQMIENYEKIISNEDLSSEQKAIAMQEISNITQDKNSIMIAENLIKNKGYEDTVILKNANSVNVIVSAKKLETEDIAKIQNIITRELNTELSNINISCK
jgi:stage III sporulation protein AH